MSATMSVDPAPTPATSLDAEWLRVSMLLAMAEAARTGETLPDGFADEIRAAIAAANAQRAAGSWVGLDAIAEPDAVDALVRLDLDILALALAPEAMPALAPRIQSLQPHLASPYPGLPLVQELFVLDAASEVDLLFDRLRPGAPLIDSRLMRLDGQGPYQTILPCPHVGQAVLNRSIDLGPPPGAHLVTRRVHWDDLVLPPSTMTALKEFVTWIRHRDTVFSAWKGRRIGGPLVLFNGPSGVGKSYSAAAIATELSARTGESWSLFALDLGRIMSKYVGETEKNLNALLDALHGRRAILQIDEADGLLGRRGEISDARDRYSNLEVSHMLSRFEQHDGPVILTTNLRSNIDSAFLRRFQLVVDFPNADHDARAKLWSLLLPPKAPREDGIAPEALAGAVTMGGGAIHNAAIYAAMLAAEETRPISYRHISRAVWRELNKESRQIRRSEIGFLANYLEEAP